VLGQLTQRSRNRLKAQQLYGAVVAQARQPEFYVRHGVPDTPEGRYELIVLHLALVMERLQHAGEPGRARTQALAETFVADMDDQLREMGVGDLSVPRKVKKAAAGLYERAKAYRDALEQGEGETLEGLIATAIWSLEAGSLEAGPPQAQHAAALARYMRLAAAALAADGWTDVLGDLPRFPEPAAWEEPY